ncbi:MAG: Nramp family divalent metal transporter, partial [Burkholderiaceae bacterium]
NSLLFVVLASSLMAILLQCLAMRLGIVTRKDLARHCRDHYSRRAGIATWLLAEIAIVACDLAEVLGSALAFHLLLGVPIAWGVALTALDTLIILGLKGKGFREIESIVLGLILTIAACYFVELMLVGPAWAEVAAGLVPAPQRLAGREPLYLAIGIVGATVMPHNLYLHSSVVQTRLVGHDDAARATAIRFSTADTVTSLLLAFLVNAAILVLAASAFHATGNRNVADIEDAYRLLEPIVGGALAGVLFAVALLASGQSSTFTGTIAGQVIMDGFLDLKIPCWKRRLITRSLALIPALAGVLWLGEHAVGKLLVFSQVVLSFQLPFAIWPLVRFTGDRRIMGRFASGAFTRIAAWTVFALITVANCWLVWLVLSE